jgi:hypothetical protein
VTRRGPTHEPTNDLRDWCGRYCEIRTGGGGAFRGVLIRVSDGWVVVRRMNGREVLLPAEALTAILDEDSPRAKALGEQPEGDEE